MYDIENLVDALIDKLHVRPLNLTQGLIKRIIEDEKVYLDILMRLYKNILSKKRL